MSARDSSWNEGNQWTQKQFRILEYDRDARNMEENSVQVRLFQLEYSGVRKLIDFCIG